MDFFDLRRVTPFSVAMQRRRLAASAAFAVMTLAGASSHAETLPDVIAYAYQVNPGIQSQRASLRALDENYVQARAGYGLNVSASAGDTSYEIRRGRTGPAAGGKADAVTDSIGLTINQPIYTGGRVHARLVEAEAQVRGGREQLRRAELDLLQRVVAAYVSVRRDEQLVVIAQDTVAVLEKELRDTQAKFNVHIVTMTDVMQSRARLAQGRTQLINIQEQLAASRAQFFTVVTRNPGSLDPPPPLEGLPASIDQAFMAAEGASPQMLAAIYAEQSSRARIAQAKAGAMPSVNARVDIQRTPTEPYFPSQYDNTRTASIVVTQPLFTSGQIRSQVRQAVEENNRDRLGVDDARLQVVQAVSSSWERLVSLRKQLDTLTEEVKANELAFYGVRAEERLALRSNIEVLNAEAELSNAQQNLTRARAAEYAARVQLLAAIGTLSPQTLSPATSSYDPSKNFRRVKNKGATPLEWPVRMLDGVVAPPIGPARPASIALDQPGGTPAEPTPGPEAPITSIRQIPDRPLAAKPQP
jgi:TolC family type I secretion outer membrane protein